MPPNNAMQRSALIADTRRRFGMKRSNIVLIMIVVSFFFAGAIDSYYFVASRQQDLTRFVHLVVLSGLLFTWCKLDVRERSIREPSGSALLVALIGIVGVPLYFFRSRPRRQALLSTLASIGFLIVAVAASLVGMLLGQYVAA